MHDNLFNGTKIIKNINQCFLPIYGIYVSECLYECKFQFMLVLYVWNEVIY